MTRDEVLARLQSLPGTFKRPGVTYAQWEQSWAAHLTRYTTSSDALGAMVDFSRATAKWLDVWGRLFGILRQPGENDDAYRTRQQETLTAWRGTIPAIIAYIQAVEGITLTVTEQLPRPGWQGYIPATLSPTGIGRLSQDVNLVRPAGVPFSFVRTIGGLYLSTGNFVGRARTTGGYLSGKKSTILPSLGPTTNNLVNTLPTVFLTDPVINPGA